MDLLSKVATFILLNLLFYGCVATIDMRNISNNLSQDIKALKTEELGISFIEKLFKNFKTNPSNEISISTSLKEMSSKLENKINNIFFAINNATLLLDNFLNNREESSSVLLPCVTEKNSALDILINSNLINNHSINEFFGSKYIMYQMRKNITLFPNALKQQYFIYEKDVKTRYSPFSECTGHDENIVWKNYMSHQHYKRKNVILLLDHGGSLSQRQLQIAKSIAKDTLKYLDVHDRVALIAIASDWSYSQTGCSDENIKSSIMLQEAKSSYLLLLESFVDSLIRGSGATNHVIGVQKALDVISKSTFNEQDTVMIMYITRGLLSSLTEARSVLKIIAQQTEDIKLPLYIHTCAVIDDSKPIMYETHFLQDVANQNFFKYNITFTDNQYRYPGYMLTVNKTDDIGFIVNNFFSIFNENPFITNKHISLPYWDHQSKDLTISFTSGWMSKNNFAMLGIDIFFSNIVEDITYYSSNQQYSYAFMINLEGVVLVHPSISRPSVVNYQLSFVDMKHLEKVSFIDELRYKLLTEYQGNYTGTNYNNNNETLNYTWSRVGQWYIICIVLNKSYDLFNKPFKASPSTSVKKLLYQNLDHSESYKFCKHLNQIATLDVASLYLSSSCFQSPFSASKSTQDKLIVQGYLAYLKDDTNLLINPGLKKEVRDEVSALAHILDFLRKRHLSSDTSKYIVRRYASSYSGVLQMFPGTVLAPGLETTKRPWFLRALQQKDRIIFVPPYLDQGGAGYIVTVAYATPHVVSAIDVTHGYMLKLILKHMPHCLNDKVTCFLIDDSGYIIYHPNLMDFDGTKPIEQQHIVHRESLVANDMLNHKHFIKKLLCNNYGDNTIQRYYKLNTNFQDVLANFVPGEHGVTYRIISVPNTNIFIGVVNASNDVIATFCPCNVIDRLCFNCNRMEEKECECPCECSLESEPKTCQDTNQNQTDNLPCKWYAEETPSTEANFALHEESNLEQCFPINCQNERSQLKCLGVIGCEWCKYDLTGDVLKKPFCASLNTCFNGVYGSISPYKGLHDLTASPESEYSPLGPILGLIIAMCLLFILLYICYRSYTNPSMDRLYLSSAQDQFRMSDVNVNDNYHDLGNHRDKLLKEDCSAPDPISPYCVATNYRRNNTAADSDHGYSTMTPHDESEHLSLAPMEVDSLEDDIMSDSTSVHTSLSFKNNPSHAVSPIFTKIPHRNCMVVPVTVHRNMEAT